MSEPAAEPKNHLALNTDWMTATLAAIWFAFCMLATAVMAWKVFTAAPVSTQITWRSLLLLVVSAWLAVRARERAVRFALAVFGLSIGSRILLRLIHASVSAQVVNAEVMRVIDLLFMIGLCLYGFRYFKQRIVRV